jgi:hypothetical protein
MIALGLLFLRLLCDRFKPRQQLEAEILVLRHQLNILQQRAPGRPHLRWVDRALFIWLYRRCPPILNAITVVRPETVLRWHRMGFAAYWRWKSRSPGGRPRIAKEVGDLIRRMSIENPIWGATKIHGELLKLGIQVAQSTVSTYMVPRRDRPLQCPCHKPNTIGPRQRIGSIFWPDERALQDDLVRADRILPIPSLAASRDPSASPSAQCPAAEITQAADLRQHRSADIRRTVWLGAECAERLGDREARNRSPVAPRGFSFVLAMEVKIAQWSSEVARGH